MEIYIDKNTEQQILFNRLIHISEPMLQFLADFYDIDYVRDWENRIKYEDRERVKKMTQSRFRIDDIRKIYSYEIPRKQHIWCNGFYGYYVQIRKAQNDIWDVLEYSNWDKLLREITRLFRLREKDNGNKCYALLKALIASNNFQEYFCTYEAKKRLLVIKAHELLNFNETIKPWYPNIDALVCSGLIFDTSSNKDRRVELPAELHPLATKIIEQYENDLL